MNEAEKPPSTTRDLPRAPDNPAARRIAERILADLKRAAEEAQTARLTELLLTLAETGLDERRSGGK